MSEATQDADKLILDGYNYCFSDSLYKIEHGRQLLRKAGALGRDDAFHYLGKSYELGGDYQKAELAYTEGLNRRHRASVYRLALLHGEKKAAQPDRNFYLRTIKQLASEKHAHSIARYTRERIKGAYGSLQILAGVVAFIPNLVRVAVDAYRDPESARFDN